VQALTRRDWTMLVGKPNELGIGFFASMLQ